MSHGIHREGIPIIALFAALTLVAWLVFAPLGWVGLVLTSWCVWFFRDPDRQRPQGQGLILSPADGRLLPIVKAAPPDELQMGAEPRTRVSIFMNIFDVHVNRIPADGRVTAIHYRPGRFFNASFDKASIFNERLSARMTTAAGHELAFVQIAGLVARRIRSTIEVGDEVKAGERYGLIRFGSRVDVYLPDGVEPELTEGQRMIAGRTVIAREGSNHPGTSVHGGTAS